MNFEYKFSRVRKVENKIQKNQILGNILEFWNYYCHIQRYSYKTFYKYSNNPTNYPHELPHL